MDRIPADRVTSVTYGSNVAFVSASVARERDGIIVVGTGVAQLNGCIVARASDDTSVRMFDHTKHILTWVETPRDDDHVYLRDVPQTVDCLAVVEHPVLEVETGADAKRRRPAVVVTAPPPPSPLVVKGLGVVRPEKEAVLLHRCLTCIGNAFYGLTDDASAIKEMNTQMPAIYTPRAFLEHYKKTWSYDMEQQLATDPTAHFTFLTPETIDLDVAEFFQS